MFSAKVKKYIGTKAFYKRALAVALPVMAQLVIQNLVSLIDNFMVAGLGDIKMSGVNVAGQINFLFIILVNTLCMSGGIFMSQFKGAEDKEGMQQSFRFKVLFCSIVGVLYFILMSSNPRGVFKLMVTVNKDAEAIVDQSIIYSKSLAISWLFMSFSMSIGSSLREIEKVKIPLVFGIAATLVNTFFNYVLIYGNFGAPKLEAAGAAYATVIARGFELVLYLVYCLVKRPPFLFNPFKLFKINFSLFGQLIKKSGMILYSEIFWAVSETFSNALYNTRGGAEVVSGMAAGFAIANLMFISFSGITTSTGVIIGQELGKGNLEESKTYKNWLLSGSIIFGSVFMILGFLFTPLVPIIFKNLTPMAWHYAIELIIIAAVYIPLWACINVLYAVSRTGGDTTMGVICDTVGNVLFILGMILLTFLTPLGPVAMYGIVKLSDVPKVIIAWKWLKNERWVVNLAEQNNKK